MRVGIIIITITALLTGCATVTISKEGDRTMAIVENSGWYLFDFIPIASGNPSRPNKVSCRPFIGTVKLKNNMQILETAMKNENAIGIRDLTSFYTDEHIFFILFKRHVLHTSAELVKESSCSLQNQ